MTEDLRNQVSKLEMARDYWTAEVTRLRAENAAMRPIVEAVARIGQDAFGEPASGPWIWVCPLCKQRIGGVDVQDGNAVTGDHTKDCPVPQAVAIMKAAG